MRSGSCSRRVGSRSRRCRRWGITSASQCCRVFLTLFRQSTDHFISFLCCFCQRSKLKMEDFKEVNKALKVRRVERVTCSVVL